jgi:hypothetical protein
MSSHDLPEIKPKIERMVDAVSQAGFQIGDQIVDDFGCPDIDVVIVDLAARGDGMPPREHVGQKVLSKGFIAFGFRICLFMLNTENLVFELVPIPPVDGLDLLLN